MPLLTTKKWASKKQKQDIISKNIRELINSWRNKRQAIAIAISKGRKK